MTDRAMPGKAMSNRQWNALEMVEAHAAERPGHTAITMDGRTTSYLDLTARAGEIAGDLERAGVRPGDIVGIALPSSPERAAAVLATWRVGAAYAPLDPEDPRHAGVAKDAGCVLVLREEPTVTSAAGAAEGPRAELGAADVACVAFTSGSSGRPNGVLLTHGGIAGYLTYVRETYELGTNDVVLQIAPFTFDAWIRDCIGPLTAGATVVMTDEYAAKSSAAIIEAIETGGVTRILHSLPSLLRDITVTAGRMNARPSTVRTVLSSGEPLRYGDCAEIRSVFGADVEIVNQYGPTECTMTSTYHRAKSGVGDLQVPIGRAIPGARIYVLTEEGAEAPVGTSGEIYLTGDGISHGYFGRPGLTADRFVPDPFSPRPGQRLYRTGDLGRCLPDGSVELLGRRDSQVKIRGKRVELGEVENVLALHETVIDAVIVPSQHKDALEAYVVSTMEGDAAELSTWLAERLPEHMIPRSVTFLEELPRTRHGKIDRRSLTAAAVKKSAPIPSPSDLERLVAGSFRQVLGVGEVGADDSFFQLGGHSLLATRLVYELGLTLGLKLPLSSIFECPTVTELAALIEQVEREQAEDPPAITPVGALDSYALSSAQRRVWLASMLDPDSAGTNVQISLRAAAPLDPAILGRALWLLTERHEVLRTTFTVTDAEPTQVIHPAGPVTIQETDLRHTVSTAAEMEAALSREVIAHSSTVFDLERGPLWHARLVRTGEQESVLLLAMHHIVVDEWSVGLLIEELSRLYDACSGGREANLPDLPLRYVDFAAWERGRLSERRRDVLTGYWHRQLDGAPVAIPLSRGGVPAGRGGRLSRELSASEAAALGKAAEARGATLYMITLAAFALLLAHRSQRRDLVVGSPVAARDLPALGSIVGFFVNILPIRLRLPEGDAPFTEFLDHVRETVLGALAHQDMPFDRLVEMVKPQRRPYRMPLIQNWFVLHNTPLPKKSRFDLLERESDSAKFDLNVALTEGPDRLTVALEYDTDLFSRTEAEALFGRYLSLLDLVSADPATTLARAMGEAEDQMTATSRRSSFRAGAAPLRPVRVAGADLVRERPLTPGQEMPLLMEPSERGAVDLAGWVADNREPIGRHLLRTGAVLFRGFDIDDVGAFEQVARSYSPAMLDYYERSTPRSEISGKVYSSTEYPPDRRIPLHSESAYSTYWPRTLWFGCLTAAERGGATTIADTRAILQSLPPELRERFAERKVMYVRNFHDGFDIPWQVAFQTEEPKVVEAYCERAGMEWEWRADGVLRTRHVVDAIVRHPETGAELWFNQVHAYHVSSLDPAEQRALRSTFAPGDLPRDVLYGDGSPIDDEDFGAIAEAHHGATIAWPWQAGDVLLIDNMLTAHGREPYEGRRKVVVAMTDAMDREKLAARHEG